MAQLAVSILTPYYLLLLFPQVALEGFPHTPGSGRVGVQRRIMMEPLSRI